MTLTAVILAIYKDEEMSSLGVFCVQILSPLQLILN